MKRMLTLVIMVLFCLTALPFGAMAAESGSCGSGITWTLDGGVLTISGSGPMDDMTMGNPWEAYKAQITTVVFTGGVTYVGATAFKDCDNLTSVSFGSSMTELGPEAFSSCDSLASLSMPASFKTFGEGSLQNCSSLKRIDCAGSFPTFRQNCLWNTYTSIYYPASRPWPVDTINQLESAFHGRVEFLGSDGTDPNAPKETTPPATEPQETEPPETEPQETEPQETVTMPDFTGLPTQPPKFTFPTRADDPTDVKEVDGDGDNTTLWLILLLVLSVSAGAAAIIIHNQQLKRRRKQRRRRPQA